MATIKSYTDIPQSKKLAEFLSIESADMYIVFENNAEPRVYYGKIPTAHFVCKPCWSLTALLSVLPDDCGIDKENGKYVASYIISDECGAYSKNNPIDAVFEMIIKLHELKML